MAPQQVFGSDPRAPIGTDDRLICHACRAIVHQMHHKLKARPTRSHADVLELLENMCDVSNLKIYEYIPPKMRKGCNDFLGKHSGDELEELFVKGGPDMSDQICLELTGVCKGIAWSAPTGVPGYDEYKPPEPRPVKAASGSSSSGKKKKTKRARAREEAAAAKDEV